MKYFCSFLLLFFSITVMAQMGGILRLDRTMVSVAAADSFIKKTLEDSKVQGAAIAIINGNKPVFLRAYGYRNQPAGEKLDTATIMYAASFSKAVFGYLCMMLAQDGLLNLDKPIASYLKKPIAAYEYFADLQSDERWKKITPRMCLSHTTGLPNVRWFSPITGEEDTAGIMKIYFEPGSKYAYSGEGFKLLQLAIEESTGRTVDDWATEKIFKPFGMYRSGYVWHNDFGDDNVAVGHTQNGLIDKKKKRTEAAAGGSMVTTIADYARFTQAVLQHKGLTKKWFEELTTPQIKIQSVVQFPPITTETTTENNSINLSYGLGWGIIFCKNGKAIFKEGNGGAWRNYTINFLEQGTAFIILSNDENGESIFQPIIDTLIGPTCIPWKWNGYVPYNKK